MDTLTVSAINWALDSSPAQGDPILGVVEAARQAIEVGAELVVLPESAILELLRLTPGLPEEDAPSHLAEFADDWIQAFLTLSKTTQSTIVAGSIFEKVAEGIQNVCPVIRPDGQVHRIAKCRLTTYEREIWKLVPGESLIALADPPIGVAICYDSEFPEAIRALAEAGVTVLCVPAFTEGKRGFQRVRWCAQASAVAHQIFVVHASLVGGLDREPAPSAYGTSAILCPSLEPFPESAVLNESPLNRFGIATADLDFLDLKACRAGGDVRNWEDRHPKHWPVDRVG